MAPELPAGDLVAFWTENEMRNLLISIVRDERGATAIEYGLIAAGIAIAIIAAVNSVGTVLSKIFGDVGTNLGS